MKLKHILQNVVIFIVGAGLPAFGVGYSIHHENWRLQELYRVFVKTADTNHDGKLSEEELQNVCRDIWVYQQFNSGKTEEQLREDSRKLSFFTDLNEEQKFFWYLQPKRIGDYLRPRDSPF